MVPVPSPLADAMLAEVRANEAAVDAFQSRDRSLIKRVILELQLATKRRRKLTPPRRS